MKSNFPLISLLVPFRPRQNFSLQYQYNIKQTSDENKEKYQLRDNRLIQNQILQTNITRTVWQTVRRITNEILGVKGLTGFKQSFSVLNFQLVNDH